MKVTTTTTIIMISAECIYVYIARPLSFHRIIIVLRRRDTINLFHRLRFHSIIATAAGSCNIVKAAR